MADASPPLAQLFSLDGRVAVLTGASGQLGREMTRALVELGARVALVDKDTGGCRQLALESALAERTAVFETDLVSRAAVDQLALDVARDLGPVDVLVNNAGIGVFTPFEERTDEEFGAVLDVNLRGTFHTIQAFARGMTAGGAIVNVASVYGLVSPDPRVYGDSGRNSAEVYGATKAAVVQLTRYYAVHLAPRGIRVNALSPGGVFADQDPAFVAAYEARTPLGRMASPGDLRGALAYLVSDASAYVTGHNLVVDGGFTAW